MQNKFQKLISLILSVQILCSVFLLFPARTNAAIDSYNFKIPIPGFTSVKFDGTTKPLAQYIEAIYKYAIGVVAILATVVMMIGGVVWITAAGDSGRVGEAKQYITGALTGLILALCSFMILQTVDPDLVRFKAIGVASVTPMEKTQTTKNGCCQLPDARPFMATQDFCTTGEDGEKGVWFFDHYPGETKCLKYLGMDEECENTIQCKPPLECINTNTYYEGAGVDFRCSNNQ